MNTTRYFDSGFGINVADSEAEGFLGKVMDKCLVLDGSETWNAGASMIVFAVADMPICNLISIEFKVVRMLEQCYDLF